MMNDDMALVREYAQHNSEQAFAMLVARHVNLVYSVALRQVGDSSLAQDVTQGVFIILSKKAKTFGSKTIVSAWLCRTARYVSSHALRTHRRREAREQEVYMQSMTNETNADAWNQIAPLLDEALGSLSKSEHDAVVLRFFERKAFADVAAAIGTSEEAARMRVSRSVDKLRTFFTKRGVTISTTVLTGVVTANSLQAAPATLASAATTLVVHGEAASSGITSLVQSAMKTMTWLKMKLAMTVGVTALVAVGAVIMVESKPHDQTQQKAPMLIVPQQSVGPVDKGMTTNEVEAVLGKPDKWAGKMMVYDKHYGMSVAQSERGVVSILCGDGELTNPGVKKFKGRTKEGVGMGSTRADVVKAFGEPALHLSVNGNVHKEKFLYQKLGLTFTLEANKVIHIEVNFRTITFQTNVSRTMTVQSNIIRLK